MNFIKRFSPTIFYTNHRPTVVKTKSSVEQLRNRCQQLLAQTDIIINGTRPWDIQVHNNDFYSRVFTDGSLGVGEAYMDGWWECEALDQFFLKVFRNELDTKVVTWKDVYAALKTKHFNRQKSSRAYQIGQHHYDIGNDLYRRMLDKRMMYSCGYWKDATTLDQAQEAKLDLICRKLQLKPGMQLLDIGCGWGGMAKYAAEKYGITVTGITVSKEQAEYAQHQCRNLQVSIELKDYRKLQGKFDRIVSIGMFEHVGHKNFLTFMNCMKKLLNPDGLTLLHTIGSNRTTTNTDKWIDRYIFPNSMIPSAKQITAAVEGLFVIEDWHNFGTDYDTTLMHWFRNFDNTWKELRGGKYDERFYRMWKYYLLSSAGSFRARQNHLWQLVLSPKGCVNGYHAPR